MRGVLGYTAAFKFAMKTYASVPPAGGRIVKKKKVLMRVNQQRGGKGFKRMACSCGMYACGQC